jgi:hypothetical protein
MTLLLFRARALYFRKTSVDAMQISVLTETDGNTIQKELLRALESARTRLAIAIAEEAKSTPRDRWQYYLDTAEHVRRFTGRLRKVDVDAPQECQSWTRALEALNQIPMRGNAFQICELLRDIVMALE